MKNIFNSVKMTRPKRNIFDLTFDHKLTTDMGRLTPVMCKEVNPGEKWTLGCEMLVKFHPLIAPIMHRINAYVHYFFVPNRIIWKHWEKYITNGQNVGDTIPDFPYYMIEDGRYTKLADYLGIPPPIDGQQERVSMLPFAAYQKICDEYYRDQNLTDPYFDDINNYVLDGNNTGQQDWMLTIRNRCWNHDYFTAALPWAQKGTSVNIPLGDVVLKGQPPFGNGNPKFRHMATSGFGSGNVTQDATLPGEINVGANLEKHAYDPDGTLEVAPTEVNNLRRAFRLQEWLEKNARGGTRYIENILMHFGVRSSDKRMQRPEYITGVRKPITVSEVLNMSATATEPQGNMSGHGVGLISGKYGKYYAEEHGYIIGILSVMPETAYQQGIEKHWLKTNDPTEFYWPSFANIGEQPVLKKELYAYQGETGDETFGYVPRYAEYKFSNNMVSGQFRDTLDFWHLGRIFHDPPLLNESFVTSDPTRRAFAVIDQNEDSLYCHVLNKVRAVRPMPKYGTPTI